jgi:hypothetical protein
MLMKNPRIVTKLQKVTSDDNKNADGYPIDYGYILEVKHMNEFFRNDA